MPQNVFRADGQPGGLSPWSSWTALDADRRGEPGVANKPSLSVADAAAHLTRAGLSWSGALGSAAVVTFAFRSTSGPMPLDTTGFSNFTAVQIQATLLALQSWSDVAGVTFVRQDDGTGYSDNAAILFGNYAAGADGAAAFASLPGSTVPGSAAGDVWVNSSQGSNAIPTLWDYGQLTLVHEIGHAIGLLHPGDYNADPDVDITYGAHAEYYEDSNQYTVMSYFGEGATGAGFGAGRYVSAPMLDDIAAAQRLYGANMTTRTGDTVYGFNATADRAWFSAAAGGPVPVFAVWDAGGTDTLDFSGYAMAQRIDLRQGAFSNVGGLTGNVSIAIGAVIENAIGGTGGDILTGNSANNRLEGRGGHDTIDGGLGEDTIVFAGPRSAYTITWQTDGAFVSGPEGTCRVSNVEFLAFSDGTIPVTPTGGMRVSGDITDDMMRGTVFSDNLSGSDGNDQIFGFDGGDQLHGGRGQDRVDGGGGNDIVYVDAGDDILLGGEGVDQLSLDSASSGVTLDMVLGVMTGAHTGRDQVSGFEWVIGTRFNDHIIGDDADNHIQGLGGLDVIHGGGGDDELIGAAVEAGGGADVLKTGDQANASRATAVSLDGAFDRLEREGVPNQGSPHATVIATTHGGVEYYAFTADANAAVNFDVDGASFDVVIRVFDAAGNELAFNDDATYDGDGGSPGDSFLHFRAPSAGTYYVQVSQYASGSGAAVVSGAPAAGGTYALHVSVFGHAVQPTYGQGGQLFGGAGDDVLRGSNGRDTLDGGVGDDVIWAGVENDEIRGGQGWDTVHLAERSVDCRVLRLDDGEYLIKTATGADRLSGVEVLRFFDGVTLDLARMYAAGAFERASDGVSVEDLLAILDRADRPEVLPDLGSRPADKPAPAAEGPEVLVGEPGGDDFLAPGKGDTEGWIVEPEVQAPPVFDAPRFLFPADERPALWGGVLDACDPADLAPAPSDRVDPWLS